jgi:catechol 2,3-dioxygenase-like lactoylglutathione lyase family enzyme
MMPFKMSGNLLPTHQDAKRAAEFYRETFGMDVYEETDNETGFTTGDFVLYMAREEGPGFC